MPTVSEVMQEHLRFAEEFIADVKKVQSKEDYIKAMEIFTGKIAGQRDDMAEIAEEFKTSMNSEDCPKDLEAISVRLHEIFGAEMSAQMGTIAMFMYDNNVVETQKKMDETMFTLPIFAEEQAYSADTVNQAAEAVAGTLSGAIMQSAVQERMKEGADAEAVEKLFDELIDLSDRYIAAVKKADNGRKMTDSTDSFTRKIKQMLPEMKEVSIDYQALHAGGSVPETIVKKGEILKEKLGTELGGALGKKQEIMSEPRVRKAVDRLGDMLNEIPI